MHLIGSSGHKYGFLIDIFKENKLSGEINSQLTYCETVLHAVHVVKRKGQSFANWFLYVDGERTNLVPLRTIRNDMLFRDEICCQ